MRPERSLTDTHAPRGSLHPAPCPLPPAPCPIPSRTCAKVICCDHLEQSISSAQLSSAQHSSFAVAQRNFVSSLWGSTWITSGSLLFSSLLPALHSPPICFMRSPALAWLGLINSAALKYDAHSVSFHLPPPRLGKYQHQLPYCCCSYLAQPARQAARQAPDWVVPSAFRTQIATRYGKLLLVFTMKRPQAGPRALS